MFLVWMAHQIAIICRVPFYVYSFHRVVTKQQLSYEVFCCCHNLKREEDSLAHSLFKMMMKNFNWHLVFNIWFFSLGPIQWKEQYDLTTSNRPGTINIWRLSFEYKTVHLFLWLFSGILDQKSPTSGSVEFRYSCIYFRSTSSYQKSIRHLDPANWPGVAKRRCLLWVSSQHKKHNELGLQN